MKWNYLRNCYWYKCIKFKIRKLKTFQRIKNKEQHIFFETYARVHLHYAFCLNLLIKLKGSIHHTPWAWVFENKSVLCCYRFKASLEYIKLQLINIKVVCLISGHILIMFNRYYARKSHYSRTFFRFLFQIHAFWIVNSQSKDMF